MKKTVFTWSQANKGTKVLNAHNFSVVDFSNFRNLNNTKNCCFGCSTRSSLKGCNMDGTVFLDFDSCAGFFLKTTNNLTARTNNVTNLIHGNGDGFNMRSKRRNLFSWLSNSFEHILHNERTTLFSLCKSTSKDIN